MPRHEISGERKALYYGGLGLMGLGFLLFISVFFSAATSFGNFHNFERRTQSQATRAIAGMVLMVVGGGLRTVGARGLAGSGVILDPQKARQDVEPWSRMAGGVVKDALSEADLPKVLGGQHQEPASVVKVRCQQCKALNDEDAKFCKQCGAGL